MGGVALFPPARLPTSALGKNRPFVLVKSDSHWERDLPRCKKGRVSGITSCVWTLADLLTSPKPISCGEIPHLGVETMGNMTQLPLKGDLSP
jgi:hypothetical protein